MSANEKFSTKVDCEVLARLRDYAQRNNKEISFLVSEAIAEYLQRSEVRPTFRTAAAAVIEEHRELLKELAK